MKMSSMLLRSCSSFFHQGVSEFGHDARLCLNLLKERVDDGCLVLCKAQEILLGIALKGCHAIVYSPIPI